MEAHVIERTPEPPEAMVPPTVLETVMDGMAMKQVKREVRIPLWVDVLLYLITLVVFACLAYVITGAFQP